MTKYYFKNDYGEGCHPNILKKLLKTNFEIHNGYGDDDYSNKARQLIAEKIDNKNAEIYFVAGGTLANLIIISATLRPHESIISASTGHVNTHEAGAIEATGHKINSIKSCDGKIRVDDIQTILDEHVIIPHMVKPRMVYISNSTEIGTVYKKKELQELSAYCKKKDLYLFLDGARLGSALCSKGNDLSLSDISNLTDIFYIGGTKNGALLSEAIVINNDEFKKDFPFHMKQRGALMSKGRLLGIQFIELFKDDLFFDLAKHANSMAMKIVKSVKQNGYSLLTESTSNQIFPILPNAIINKLEKKYGFHRWGKIDNEKSAIRLVTSWATKKELVNEFISDLSAKSNM